MRVKVRITGVLYLFFLCFSSCQKNDTLKIDPEAVQQELISLIQDVTKADAYRYSVHDDAGNSMDCLKVIEYQNDTFIGVYHTYKNETFVVNLATSTNLLDWHFERELGSKDSQPDIYKTSDNNYVIAWEQIPTGFSLFTVGYIRVLYYENYADLLMDRRAKDKSIPNRFSICAEGTPNIYYADRQTVRMGFHYWNNCDIDRQGAGTLTNFSNWSSVKESLIDKALLSYGPRGNIGDRDDFSYKGVSFLLIEAQDVKNDFSTWKSYIYHPDSGKALPLNLTTHTGPSSAGNGTVSMLKLNGQNIVLVTQFLFRDTQGGCLIYYKILPK